MHRKLCRAPWLYVIVSGCRTEGALSHIDLCSLASASSITTFGLHLDSGSRTSSLSAPLIFQPFLLSHHPAYPSLLLWRHQISWLSPQPPFTHTTHPLPLPPSPLPHPPQASPSPQWILNEVLPKPPWRYTQCMTTVHLGLTTRPCKICQEPPNLHTAVLAIQAVRPVHITLRLQKASGLVLLVHLPGLQPFRQRAAHPQRIRAHPTWESGKTYPQTTIPYCLPNRFQSLPPPRSTAVAGPSIPIRTALTKQPYNHNRDTSAPVPLKVDPPQQDHIHPQD